MPLNLFYTMVQKSQKWPKTQIKGSCLNNEKRVFDQFSWEVTEKGKQKVVVSG